MDYHPNESKFRKWLDQKFRILKLWLDILIPIILLIEKHPLLEFLVWKWQNHLHLILSPSETPLSSMLKNWQKSLFFHWYLPKGPTDFDCRKLKLYTLNYHNPQGWPWVCPGYQAPPKELSRHSSNYINLHGQETV